MIRAVFSASYAIYFSLVYCKKLEIRSEEVWRYFLKSLNLGLCYGAFVQPWSAERCAGAGKAAFLCCAYDVVSDWRRFSKSSYQVFVEILRELASEYEVAVALDLYSKETERELEDDGLERGVYAVRFILSITEAHWYFEDFGVEKLGILLQIADDIIDLEGDLARSEMNCLLTSNKKKYLRLFLDEYHGLLGMFRGDPVMRIALVASKRRANALLLKR